MGYSIRDFSIDDAEAVNRVALAAFGEYQSAYSDWPAFSKNIANMAALSQHGEIIVATDRDAVVGAVVYVGPGKPKAAFFEPQWPIIRMLVVQPRARGQGIGRALTQECVRRAERDGARCIALHTTPIMTVALPMYQRMGFEFLREAPALFGVPYGVFLKRLSPRRDAPDAPDPLT